ncbi:MAG TPA: BamA/TamA family outer membrane protein [Gemmatimonadales bacterium]|nr:BamA/TamA family outer membrane protein [Gemmatimonadales bacterium]
MSTEWRRVAFSVGTTALLALFVPGPVRGQTAPAADGNSTPGPGAALLPHLTAETQVAAIRFRFTDHRSVDEDELRQQLGLTERTDKGVRQAISSPFGGAEEQHRFSPLELQRDVVRLRAYYGQIGFPHAVVRYDVVLPDTSKNEVDVTYLVTEGPPVVLRRVAFVAGERGDSFAVPSLEAEWRAFRARAASRVGRRFGQAAASELERETVRWLADHGYPRARASVDMQLDTATQSVQAIVRVQSGARARVGDIQVEGLNRLGESVIRRELPFQTGDWYSARALEEARGRLRGVEMIESAAFEVPAGAPTDTVVPIRVRIREALPRRVTVDGGYDSDAGIIGQAQWTHRNFLGGGRGLDFTLLAQTGALSYEANPDILYRGTLSLRQPHVLGSRLLLVVAPFGEYRDDARDRSWQVGTDVSLVWRRGAQRSVALTYRLAWREVLGYGFADFSGGSVEFVDLLVQAADQQLQSLGGAIQTGSLNLTATYGTLDHPTSPRRGFIVRPSLELTAPSAWNTNQYFRFDVGGTGFVPLGERVGLMLRFAGGHLIPFGRSIPQPGETPLFQYLDLRDALFTAGGAGDVRGWGTRLVGPKFPRIRFDSTASGIDTVITGYSPVGGFSRVSATVELRFPLPGAGPNWGAHTFVDGGRVWTDDARFGAAATASPEQRHAFFSLGAGVDWRTIVGPVRVDVGYKLNPSTFDVADPKDIFAALEARQPVAGVPTSWLKRLHVHISFGATY